MRLKKYSSTSLTLISLIPVLLLGACEQSEKTLQLPDLTQEEHTYIERLVVLERAKAIALNDREKGSAVLDSLSQAWGDSVESETAAIAPAEPIRSRAVHDLLKRIIAAEHDSLLLAPTIERLSVPLPDPQVKVPEKPAAE